MDAASLPAIARLLAQRADELDDRPQHATNGHPGQVPAVNIANTEGYDSGERLPAA
jgi:hypothetical protein